MANSFTLRPYVAMPKTNVRINQQQLIASPFKTVIPLANAYADAEIPLLPQNYSPMNNSYFAHNRAPAKGFFASRLFKKVL